MTRFRIRTPASAKLAAFSLVELLIVIAIIAIMASIVIAAFSNAAADSRGVLVRQQQAVVQEAINSWIASKSSGTGSLLSARNAYSATGIATSLDRLALIQQGHYLDDATYAELTGNTAAATPDHVQSGAMVKTGQYLEITTWANGSYPKVILH